LDFLSASINPKGKMLFCGRRDSQLVLIKTFQQKKQTEANQFHCSRRALERENQRNDSSLVIGGIHRNVYQTVMTERVIERDIITLIRKGNQIKFFSFHRHKHLEASQQTFS
jgi:tRNA pseudouridine-54 N-methylase